MAEPEPPRERSRLPAIWAFNALVAAAAVGVYLLAVAPLAQTGALSLAPIIVLVGIVAAFTATEWGRVYIHFRQEAQSYSLSEIPLVIGLFVLAPDQLVLARVLGAAVALGLVRRQDPKKLVFNLASFALEAETLTVLVHRVAGAVARPESSDRAGSGCSLFMSRRLPPRLRAERLGDLDRRAGVSRTASGSSRWASRSSGGSPTAASASSSSPMLEHQPDHAPAAPHAACGHRRRVRPVHT